MSIPPPLPGALGTLAPVLDHYGYLAVAGLILLEDFGVPVPGETVLIAAAVSFWQRLFSADGFTAVAHVFIMEWAAILRDLVLGLLIAGAIGAWVPASFWRSFFLTDHPVLSALWDRSWVQSWRSSAPSARSATCRWRPCCGTAESASAE